MTPSFKRGAETPSGCPCGGDHSPPYRRRQRRKPLKDLGNKILPAHWAGKAHQSAETRIWHVEYHADCKSPLAVPQHSTDGLLARYSVRCRKCGACRRAKRNYWGFAAMNQTLQTDEQGRRTWFGTLTLSPEAQAELLGRAMKRSPEPSAEWWKDKDCHERYKRVCAEFLTEVQKYWKRLRKAGLEFSYMAVFEAHKSGLPHAHFLLHEKGERILKKSLTAKWYLGFSQMKLVGGSARNAAAPNKAAWYVTKYITKTNQTRIRASRGYVPEKRPEAHSQQAKPVDV